MLSDVAGVGVSECTGRTIFKENWICTMPRHHPEPNINMLLTRNLPFDSDIRQWSHPLMMPLHCLWSKSIQFEFQTLIRCKLSFQFLRSFLLCIRGSRSINTHLSWMTFSWRVLQQASFNLNIGISLFGVLHFEDQVPVLILGKLISPFYTGLVSFSSMLFFN